MFVYLVPINSKRNCEKFPMDSIRLLVKVQEKKTSYGKLHKSRPHLTKIINFRKTAHNFLFINAKRESRLCDKVPKAQMIPKKNTNKAYR